MDSQIKSQLDDEVDLLGLFITIWNNKSKVFFIAFVAVIIMFGFQVVTKHVPEYVATTEIRPISSFDELEYKSYNLYYGKTNQEFKKPFSVVRLEKNNETQIEKEIREEEEKEFAMLAFQPIGKKYLINLFIEKLKENTLIKNEIKRYGMVKKEDYKDQQAYEDEVTRVASLIKYLPPNRNNKQGNIENNWRIQFVTDDKQVWKNFLKNINKPANEEIRLHLNKNHDKFIENKKRLKKFNIEDIEMKMKDAMINYENMASRKLTYLNEQAQIARKLNVAKNNLITPTIDATATAIITLASRAPDYMRGYEMIEEEISLITKRTDKEAFIEGFDLLERIKRDLISDKDADRLDTLFEGTPIYDYDDFYAAKIMFQSTDYEILNERNAIKMLFLAFIIGAMLGIFYVLISNAIYNRK